MEMLNENKIKLAAQVKVLAYLMSIGIFMLWPK